VLLLVEMLLQQADPWPLGDVQVGFTSVYDIQTLKQGDKAKTTRYDILANI
jgi:hypothetical protein